MVELRDFLTHVFQTSSLPPLCSSNPVSLSPGLSGSFTLAGIVTPYSVDSGLSSEWLGSNLHFELSGISVSSGGSMPPFVTKTPDQQNIRYQG